MINSAKDYDLMMFKILINIQQGNYTQKEFDFSISESTYLQLMSHLIDYNYVEGFRLISLLGGSGIKARNPKLTREGLTFINNYLIDNLLMELVRRAQSKGIEKASIFINDLDQRLGVKLEHILSHIEQFKYDGLISIESKLQDNELHPYQVKLTSSGYNELLGISANLMTEHNEWVESTDLSNEQKKELTELINNLLIDQGVSADNESKIKYYFGKLAGEKTAVIQSVLALVKSII